MGDPDDKIIAFPVKGDDGEIVELPEDIYLELQRASFQTGIPETELLELCIEHLANYVDEHGHIPFMAVDSKESSDTSPR